MNPSPLAPLAGVGLRAPHYPAFSSGGAATGWLEVHAENYFAAGGPHRRHLAAAAEHYPISVHGVGLSLGSADGLDADHLDRLARLVGDLRPALVSEHLAWCRQGGRYLNDLLALPLTAASLDRVADNVARTQDRLGRLLLVENPSSYLAFAESTLSEPEFLAELVARTGCGLLLDVNNVFVSAHNLGFDARDYLAAYPVAAVGEIHLAGHCRNPLAAGPDGAADAAVLIDSHNAPVAPAVWALYRQALALTGPVPTLIEWDADLPPVATLLAEAATAQALLTAAALPEPRDAA